MLRLFGLLLLLGLAVLAIEPKWNASSNTLSLRVRQPNELFSVVRSVARGLGERAVERAQKAVSTPDVSAPSAARSSEQLSESDRRELDRVIKEKTEGEH